MERYKKWYDENESQTQTIESGGCNTSLYCLFIFNILLYCMNALLDLMDFPVATLQNLAKKSKEKNGVFNLTGNKKNNKIKGKNIKKNIKNNMTEEQVILYLKDIPCTIMYNRYNYDSLYFKIIDSLRLKSDLYVGFTHSLYRAYDEVIQNHGEYNFKYMIVLKKSMNKENLKYIQSQYCSHRREIDVRRKIRNHPITWDHDFMLENGYMEEGYTMYYFFVMCSNYPEID